VPVEHVGTTTIEVAGGLAEEEGRDKGHEEHEVAGKCGKDAHAITREQSAGAAAVAMVVPVFIAAAATGWTTIYWWPAAKSRVFPFALGIDDRPGERSGHGSTPLR
jgi:hypothetical protein